MLEMRSSLKLNPALRVLLIALPVLCFFVCLGIGRMTIPPGEVLRAVLAGAGAGGAVPAQIRNVVWSMRMPRLILASLVGAGLSVSGCAFQGLFSNPLATSDTLLFGVAALLLTGISGKCLTGSKTTTILAGIMVGSLFSSLVSLVKFTADTESQLPAITYWLMGSFESAGYASLAIGAPAILIGCAVLLCLRWRMNLLPLSEDEAVSSGVNIRALRLIVEFCATLITASCVSMCGQVGWVGLIVPHICRLLVGSNQKVLLPVSVSVGAAFMMIVDTLARTASPKEIPISILTAVIGAPFFILLLRKNKGWAL